MRALLLAVLAALLGAAFLAGSLLQRETAQVEFLQQALGGPLATAPLTRTPDASTVVQLHEGGYSLDRGNVSVGLRSTDSGSDGLERRDNGVSRRTPYGWEAVTVTPAKTEQFLTVVERQGPKTWRWQLKSLNLTPRVGDDGAVGFIRHRLRQVRAVQQPGRHLRCRRLDDADDRHDPPLRRRLAAPDRRHSAACRHRRRQRRPADIPDRAGDDRPHGAHHRADGACRRGESPWHHARRGLRERPRPRRRPARRVPADDERRRLHRPVLRVRLELPVHRQPGHDRLRRRSLRPPHVHERRLRQLDRLDRGHGQDRQHAAHRQRHGSHGGRERPRHNGCADERLDRTLPTGSVTAPASGATVGGSAVALTASAADVSGSGVALVEWQVKLFGAGTFNTVASDTSAPYEGTWNATGAPDGATDIHALITDAAGNVRTTAVIPVTVDSTGPSVTLTDPGAVVSGTVALNASTGGGAVRVAFGVSPAGAGTWTEIASDTSAPFDTSFDTRTVADGLYDLRAIGYDSLGNPSSPSVRANVRFDNIAPQLVSSAPADGSVSASANQIVLTASEPVTAPGATLDGSPAPVPTVSGSTLTFATGALSDGLHVLAGEIEDASGTRTTFRVAITIESTPSSDPPPVERSVASPETKLVFSVAGSKKLTVAKRITIAARIKVSRPADVTATLYTAKKQRLYTWRLKVNAGANVVKLRLPTQIRQPGTYTLTWVARSGTQTTRRTVKVTLVGPKLAQVKPKRGEIEVVLAGEQPAKDALKPGLAGTGTRVVATANPDQTFALTASAARNVGVVVVDVDAYGLGFVSDLRTVFPSLRLIAIAREPATRALAVRAGAVLAIPRNTPPRQLAKAIATVAGR